jgi:hypothetical protein
LKAQSARFAIRVDAETWILHPSYQGPLAGLGLRPGGRKVWLTQAQYAKEEREDVNLLAVWASEQQEPWFIATNLDDPILAERMYRKSDEDRAWLSRLETPPATEGHAEGAISCPARGSDRCGSSTLLVRMPAGPEATGPQA